MSVVEKLKEALADLRKPAPEPPVAALMVSPRVSADILNGLKAYPSVTHAEIIVRRNTGGVYVVRVEARCQTVGGQVREVGWSMLAMHPGEINSAAIKASYIVKALIHEGPPEKPKAPEPEPVKPVSAEALIYEALAKLERHPWVLWAEVLIDIADVSEPGHMAVTLIVRAGDRMDGGGRCRQREIEVRKPVRPDTTIESAVLAAAAEATLDIEKLVDEWLQDRGQA